MAYCLSIVPKYASKTAFANRHRALAAHIAAMGWEAVYEGLAVAGKPGPTSEGYKTNIVRRGPVSKMEGDWLRRQKLGNTAYWQAYLLYRKAEERRSETKYAEDLLDKQLNNIGVMALFKDVPRDEVADRIIALSHFPKVRVLGSRRVDFRASLPWMRTIPTLGEVKEAVEYLEEFNMFVFNRDDADKAIPRHTVFVSSAEKTFLLWRAKSWLLLGNPLGYVPTSETHRELLAEAMHEIVEIVNEKLPKVGKRERRRQSAGRVSAAGDMYLEGTDSEG
jgi:hypothetical protein